jgi:hypothetical protein
MVPGATLIGLDDVYDPKGHLQRGEIEATARSWGIQTVAAELKTAADCLG